MESFDIYLMIEKSNALSTKLISLFIILQTKISKLRIKKFSALFLKNVSSDCKIK